MGLKDLFKKKDTCVVCKGELGKKPMTAKGKMFCSKKCSDKFMKAEKAHVCEYC